MQKRRNRIILFGTATILLLLSLYFGSYTLKSINGQWRYSQSGEVRYQGRTSVSDIVIWEPEGIWYQSDFTSAAGKKGSRGSAGIYTPLVILDRNYWHTTKTIIKRKEDGSYDFDWSELQASNITPSEVN